MRFVQMLRRSRREFPPSATSALSPIPREQFATVEPLWRAMVDRVGLRVGDRVLEIGCDGIEPLIHLRGAQLVRGEAERFLADGGGDASPSPESYDALLVSTAGQAGLDPIAHLPALLQLVRRGGRLALAIRGEPLADDMQRIFASVREVVAGALPGEAPPAMNPRALEARVRAADARMVATGEIDCVIDYANGEAAWRALRHAQWLQPALDVAGEAAVRVAVLLALTPHRRGGRVRLVNRVRYAVIER